MLILFQPNATRAQRDAVAAQADDLGLRNDALSFDGGFALRLAGPAAALKSEAFEKLAGVRAVRKLSQKFSLSSRDAKPESTVVDLGDGVRIGDGSCVMIAGPCSIENEDQAFTIAHAIREAGVRIMRGGLFKPRTSPFSFQGLGADGFELMKRVREECGLKFVTEAMDEESLEIVKEHADMIQIGSRNMQNFALLKRVGRARKPVLLKRGMSSTFNEMMLAADYILSGGNGNLVLCERGVRTFADHTRNTLDLSVVPLAKQLSHLPIIVDPSHGTGRRDLVTPMALAGIASGADGLIIEVHNNPDCALSDGDQSLTIEGFLEFLPRARAVAEAMGSSFSSAPAQV